MQNSTSPAFFSLGGKKKKGGFSIRSNITKKKEGGGEKITRAGKNKSRLEKKKNKKIKKNNRTRKGRRKRGEGGRKSITGWNFPRQPQKKKKGRKDSLTIPRTLLIYVTTADWPRGEGEEAEAQR